MTFVLVTGTSTGVGKTVALAALAARSVAARRRVAVVKPVQTGVGHRGPDESALHAGRGTAPPAAGAAEVKDAAEAADVDAIHRLTGIAGSELVRLADPLAPDTAARLRGVQIPGVRQLAEQVAGRAGPADVTFVEGAGGVLVRLDTEGGTLLDLGLELHARGRRVVVVIVTALALGTLNHTELTVRAVRRAGLEPAGLVLGDVPARLGLAERLNREELPRVTGMPVLGAIPHGAGALSRREFVAAAPGWVSLVPAEPPNNPPEPPNNPPEKPKNPPEPPKNPGETVQRRSDGSAVRQAAWTDPPT